MRWPIAIFFILFLINYIGTVSVYASQKPEWCIPVHYSKDYKAHENHISNGLCYLLSDVQVNLITQEEYRCISVKVLEENGLNDVSSITKNYDSTYQSLEFLQVHIIRNGKIINVLNKQKPEILRRESKLEQGIIDGGLTSYLEINDLRVGDILEYSFVVRGFNPIKKDFVLFNYVTAFSVPVGKIHISFVTDKPNNYSYKQFNFSAEPKIIKKKNVTIYDWIVLDPEVLDSESDAPSWYDPYPQIFFSSNFSWDQLVSRMLELYSSNQPDCSEMKELLSEIRASSENKYEQARYAIRYVQNTIRYLGNENGIYSFKPRNPNVIVQKKSGDCKEKSWLLCHLLNELGFKAYPMLVNSYKGYVLDQYPASFESFDHCVSCYMVEDDTLYVDPTIHDQGGNLSHI